MREVFLEENKSKYSINDEANLSLDITESAKELPFSEVKDVLSLYELYNAERDACGKYRMIFTINSFCSNVLFNTKTEVVKNEGSSSCIRLFDNSNVNHDGAISGNKLNLQQAVRDTEYSHEGNDAGRGFTYHCGLDIFNNHTLRSDEYTHVNNFTTWEGPDEDKKIYRYILDAETNKYTFKDTGKDLDSDTFNSIRDYRRDDLGKALTSPKFTTVNNTGDTQVEHIYEYATIKTMKNAIADNLVEKDGWYGFTNPSSASIKINGKKELINRTINSEDACSFIDMYPGKKEYSFVPRYNPYFKRLEKNWDYCITYPYKNDYTKFNEINGSNGINAIQVIKIETTNKYGETNNNVRNYNDIVCFTTKIRHNLKTGDEFILIHKDGDNYKQKKTPITIVGVGDGKGHDKEHKFRFSAEPILDYLKKGALVKNFTFIKKYSNGAAMDYYFRKFKKLQNFKTDLSTFYNPEVDVNSLTGFSTTFSNEINNMAFGQTIYGDQTAQLVFTDDINIDRICDNYGRPVSELYLTFIKRNKGHNEWYNSTNETIDCSNIEYSHCFGKVTSGIEMADDFAGVDYNIHRMHNHDKNSIVAPNEQRDVTIASIGDIDNGKKLEDDITIDNTNVNEFYGDIVEYNPATAVETVIEKVYHRFNTAQRELNSSAYYNIYDDELIKDDYDIVDADKNTFGFRVTEQIANMVKDKDTKPETMAGNIEREGYYYQPHYKIAVRELSDVKKSSAIFINNNIAICTQAEENTLKNKYEWLNHDLTIGGMKIIKIQSPKNYDFQLGDYFAIVNVLDAKEQYSAKLIDITTSTTLTLEVSAVDYNKIVSNNAIDPKYKLYKSKDGYVEGMKLALTNNPRFVYREVVAPSELTQDSKLYDLPFANGAFYIEQKINFYLKRQDPFGKYGLSRYSSNQASGNNPMKEYLYIPGTEYYVEANEMIIDGFGGTCNV